jgi:hypothetical protein
MYMNRGGAGATEDTEGATEDTEDTEVATEDTEDTETATEDTEDTEAATEDTEDTEDIEVTDAILALAARKSRRLSVPLFDIRITLSPSQHRFFEGVT